MTTTHGIIDTSGKWLVLFYYPADFTPVCGSEIDVLAKCYSEFTDRDVTVIAISPDSIESHNEWKPGCVVPMATGEYKGRRTEIHSPSGELMYAADYPKSVGRSISEIIRIIDGLQLNENCLCDS